MVSIKKKKRDIDLKKRDDNSIGFDKKVDVDLDAGGLGITFDVKEFENGDKISIGYSVDAPFRADIDYNVDSNELGLSGGVEVPGDLIGLSGGVTIDLNSGEITGGEIGVALGGVDVFVGEGKCERTISVTVFGVVTSYTQKKDNPACDDDREKEDEEEEDKKDPLKIPDPPPIELIPGDPDQEVYYLSGRCGFAVTIFTELGDRDAVMTESSSVSGSVDWEPYVKDYYKDNKYVSVSYQTKAQASGTGWSWTYTNGVQTGTILDENGWPLTDTYFWGPRSLSGIAGGGAVRRTTIGNANRTLSNRSIYDSSSAGADGSTFTKKGWGQTILLDYYITKTGKTKPPPPPKPPIPPIEPPRREEMSCCDLEPVLSLLRKMSDVLAVEEMSTQGVKVPNRLFVPNGKGHTECKTYPDLIVTQIRIADHLGIHPYKAQIDDSNAAQAGNQKLEVQVINATAAAKMISELLLENKGDAATRLNLLVRNTVATGQVLNAVAIAAKRIREVMRFLSIPVKEKIDYINMPFDFSFGNRDKKKGFQAGAKPNEALDINTEEATEKMLPKFMVNSKQPYVVEIFDDKQGTLLDILLKQSK